jgi:hypothetical protein
VGGGCKAGWRRGVEALGGLGKGVADEHARFVRIMEAGEDGEADVFGGIGNDADDLGNAAVRAEVHHFGDFRSAIGGHGLKRREVGENAEAGLKFGEESGCVAEAFAALRRVDDSDERDEEQLSGFVDAEQDHGGLMIAARARNAMQECCWVCWAIRLFSRRAVCE